MAAARRAARIGNGYFPGGGLDDDELRKRIDVIHRECEIVGRDVTEIELTVHSDLTDADLLSARIEELVALGVDRLVIDNLRLPADQLRSVTENSRPALHIAQLRGHGGIWLLNKLPQHGAAAETYGFRLLLIHQWVSEPLFSDHFWGRIDIG